MAGEGVRRVSAAVQHARVRKARAPERTPVGANGVVLEPGSRVGNQTLRVEPIGARRLPNINLLDLRVEKRFVLKASHSVALRMNIFNALNINSVVSLTQQSGPNFGKAVTIVSPRILEFSVQVPVLGRNVDFWPVRPTRLDGSAEAVVQGADGLEQGDEDRRNNRPVEFVAQRWVGPELFCLFITRCDPSGSAGGIMSLREVSHSRSVSLRWRCQPRCMHRRSRCGSNAAEYFQDVDRPRCHACRRWRSVPVGCSTANPVRC